MTDNAKELGTDYFDFNSHAHVERDEPEFDLDTFYAISTHTLTWSVTFINPHQNSQLRISTHTLTWSVTVEKLPKELVNSFQLTRSRGA